MRVGTKSVFFGAHCFFIHPFFVAAAWRKLYGFPWDPRLWAAFFLHDIGYLGRPNMDSIEGEQHVLLGGIILGCLFGAKWRDFALCHSRHWAKRLGKAYSRLCVADKLAFVMTPAWLYLPMARASGELAEYMRVASARQSGGQFSTFELSLLRCRNPEVWLEGLKSYTRRWIEKHRDGRADRWTVIRPAEPEREACNAR
jgi:hypothetical protein